MAQPTNNILTPEQLDGTDYRKQYVEIMSDATDFATADTSLVLATVPFLPVGDSFVDIPLYPVGIRCKGNGIYQCHNHTVGKPGYKRLGLRID